MRHKQSAIHEKGFSFQKEEHFDDIPIDFGRLKVGTKNLIDPVVNINSYKRINSQYGNKDYILKAIYNNECNSLREISNLFYKTSGIYSTLCDYLAYLYRYDWYIIPYIKDDSAVNQNKILKEFSKVLDFYENSQIVQTCGNIALSVIKDGCYYGYISDSPNGIFLQDLPVKYCRSRFNKDGFPTVEFNLKYFDDNFSDIQYRLRVLNSFPKEFSQAYILYKKNKLTPDFQGDQSGWYLLDPERSIKFNAGGGNDIPFLINVIPSIIDLNEAQELDKKKMMQKLLKIVIQKLPMDKNGELIFDVDEALDIHSNAVAMLKNAIGVDVLTTFADIDVADLSDSANTTTKDELLKVERAVYNESGTAHNLFNSESNLSLEKSILNDEASIRNLIKQIQAFYNRTIKQFNTNKKYNFKFKMLETTIHNYKDLSKLYKEQTQMGYSKMLPQIALGHTQSEILATSHFENNILNLTEIMIPPLMSSTMSSEQVLSNKKINTEEKKVGRPEKEDSQKSDKTIANKESM